MRKIIVGFKADECSRDALRFGGMLARELDAELLVVNVYSTSHGFRPGEEERLLLRAKATTALAEAERLLPYGSQPTLRALEGRSVQCLHDLAAEEHADLIVLGSTTKRALELHAVGGVPERLLQGATCPVVVVPRGYRYERDPGVHLIGVAVDGSPESHRAVEVAADIALAAHSGFKLIGIVEPSPPPMVGMASMYVPDSGTYRDSMLRELEQTADALPRELRPEIVMVDGEAAPELIERSAPLSLLVMGSRSYGPVRRALLGSVSSHVLRAASCPVLIVPRGVAESAVAASG